MKWAQPTISAANLLVVTCLALVCVCSAEGVRQDAGIKLLIPSSARTSFFKSFLVVVNLADQPNHVTITARREDGSTIGSLETTVPTGGRFRSADILGDMGAALGEFGPLTVESSNGMVLTAVSEVSSNQGPGGFFPGINVDVAWREGILSEVIDTGDAGTLGTFRTNIGVNTVANSNAIVTITLHDSLGAEAGRTTIDVPGNGMKQINSVVRQLLNSGGAVTGQNGYLKFSSDQPIIAWASKVENGSGDPSFQIGIGAASESSSQPWQTGVFKGLVTQTHPTDSYTMWVTLTDAPLGSVVGTSYYERVDCGGKLTLSDRTSTRMELSESVFNSKKCEDSRLTIVPQTNDTLSISGSPVSVPNATLSGTLARVK